MKRIAKTILTLASITCMLLVFGLAGGSDAGTVSAGQALTGGLLGVTGCIGCAVGANRIEGREARKWKLLKRKSRH